MFQIKVYRKDLQLGGSKLDIPKLDEGPRAISEIKNNGNLNLEGSAANRYRYGHSLARLFTTRESR